jgi:hypothetical protein
VVTGSRAGDIRFHGLLIDYPGVFALGRYLHDLLHDNSMATFKKRMAHESPPCLKERYVMRRGKRKFPLATHPAVGQSGEHFPWSVSIGVDVLHPQEALWGEFWGFCPLILTQ